LDELERIERDLQRYFKLNNEPEEQFNRFLERSFAYDFHEIHVHDCWF